MHNARIISDQMHADTAWTRPYLLHKLFTIMNNVQTAGQRKLISR